MFNIFNKNNNFKFRQSNKKSIFDEWAKAKNAEGFTSLVDRLPNPDKILRKTGKNISVYRDLVNHYQVGACIEQRQAGTKSSKWNLLENTCNKEHYKIYNDILKNTDILSLIGNILNAYLFGYSPIEITWKKFGSYILPVEYTEKPHEWFYFNSEGDFFFKDKTQGGKKQIDFKNNFKFLLPRNNPTFLNPYGQAVLSRCFWNVAFINGGMEFWVKFSEKYGMPYMFGKYDRNMTDKEKTDFLKTLSDMVQDAIGLIPSDGSVDIMQTGSSGSSEIYKDLITKCENNISKAILGQTLTTDIGNNGSYAASQTHFGVREDIINSDKQLVEKTINQLISFINIVNFNDDITPKFEFETKEDLGIEKAQRDNQVAALGVKFSKKYLMRTYNYQEEDIEIIDTSNYGMNFSDSDDVTARNDGISGDVAVHNKNNRLPRTFSARNDNTDFDLLDKLSEQKYFENLMSKNIETVIKFFNETRDSEQALEQLAELYPGLNTEELEQALTKVIFISDLMGRLSTMDN